MSLNIRLIKLGTLVFSPGRLARLGLCWGVRPAPVMGVAGGFEHLALLSALVLLSVENVSGFCEYVGK